VGKVIALLSWYDESPSWLASCVASVAPHVDHIVAVDGAYAHYPDARARSDRSQAETIQATAEGLSIGCTIYRPASYWLGGEVEKRSAMFRLGQAHRDGFDDWYWVIDADCVVTQVPSDYRDALAATEANAVDVTLFERRDYLGDHPEIAQVMNLPTAGGQTIPMLFRALKDMQVIGAHYIYGGFDANDEWHYVWGPPAVQPDARDVIENIHVEHRSIWRDLYRRDNAKRYYEVRDELGIERIRPRDENGNLQPVQVKRS
jgi:hypothetical protein